MIINYSDLYRKLIIMNNKTKKLKDIQNKLYIWCFNDFIKNNIQI
jgi:hypothetical protein